MLDVKQAAERAVDYMRTLPAQGDVRDVVLEEAELSEDERYWFITLSYVQGATFLAATRRYRTFRIEAATGRVVSMKLREVK